MIQIRRNRDGMDELLIAGENRSRPSLPITASMVPGGLEDLARARKLTWDDVLPGSYDPHQRLQVMDEEGIDVAVMYPSLLLLYGDIDDPLPSGGGVPRLQQLAGGFLQGLAQAALWRRTDAAPERRRIDSRDASGGQGA